MRTKPVAERFPKLITDFEAENARLRLLAQPPLNATGGDGTSGGMEVRVARLESDVDYIKRDVGEIKLDLRGLKGDVTGLKVDVARLDERVKALPSKGFIVTATVTIIGVLTAAVAFADKLRALLG